MLERVTRVAMDNARPIATGLLVLAILLVASGTAAASPIPIEPFGGSLIGIGP